MDMQYRCCCFCLRQVLNLIILLLLHNAYLHYRQQKTPCWQVDLTWSEAEPCIGFLASNLSY